MMMWHTNYAFDQRGHRSREGQEVWQGRSRKNNVLFKRCYGSLLYLQYPRRGCSSAFKHFLTRVVKAVIIIWVALQTETLRVLEWCFINLFYTDSFLLIFYVADDNIIVMNGDTSNLCQGTVSASKHAHCQPLENSLNCGTPCTK